MPVNIYGIEVEEVSWGDIVEGAAAVAARVTRKVEGKVEYAAKVVVDGQSDQAPVSLAVDWWSKYITAHQGVG